MSDMMHAELGWLPAGGLGGLRCPLQALSLAHSQMRALPRSTFVSANFQARFSRSTLKKTMVLSTSWKLCAALALAITTSAVALAQDANATKSFDFSAYCNGSSKYDSMVSGPSGTRYFSAKQEFVGVTDWFLTGQYVFDQFRNMWSEPFLCKVKFTSDPFTNYLGTYETGHFGAESWSYNTPNTWQTIVADYSGSYNWFFLESDACIKNLMIACNGAASNGLGDVAISVGNGFWENLFGTCGMAWTHCGPDGTGVKLVEPTSLAVYFTPWSFSGNYDRFYTASVLHLEELPTIRSRCYSGPDKQTVVGRTIPYCTTNE